jgi:alanyl-tRNA synthetase
MPNVLSCSQIGAFKVVSEAGIASGVRRIEAVVGPAAIQYLNQLDGIVKTLGSQLKVKYEEIPGRVASEHCSLSLMPDTSLPSDLSQCLWSCHSFRTTPAKS